MGCRISKGRITLKKSSPLPVKVKRKRRTLKRKDSFEVALELFKENERIRLHNSQDFGVRQDFRNEKLAYTHFPLEGKLVVKVFGRVYVFRALTLNTCSFHYPPSEIYLNEKCFAKSQTYNN